MMDCYDVNRQYLYVGAQAVQIKLIFGEPLETKKWQKDGSNYEQYIFERINITCKNGLMESYEEIKPIHPDPLPEALKSLEKAEELDIEKSNSKDIKEQYVRLKKYFERQAIEEFTNENFKGSLDKFKLLLSINDKPVMGGIIDTVIYFNTGMTASRAGVNEDAIKYYELARKYKHNEPTLYIFLKSKYFEVGDTAKGLTVLEEGFKRYPSNAQVLIELINYYLLRGEAKEALDYLNLAKKEDPNNISFIFAEATLYDRSGNMEKAKETYLKCIELDSSYFNAYYNLGVMHYNAAVKLYTEADKIMVQKDYDIAKAKGDEVLAQSIPYMEKANQMAESNTTWPASIKQENVSATLETLKTLYYRMKMTDKYDAVMKKLGN
jgi:tetratricopeptide (TPR) repeat protein